MVADLLRRASDTTQWEDSRESSRSAPHDLRRWFVTTLLETGVDVFQVARLVGHARVQTTLRYDRRKLERLRATVELLAVPMFDELSEP